MGSRLLAALPWLPFGVLASFLAVRGFSGDLRLDLSALALIWAVGICWLLGHRLMLPALIFSLLAIPLFSHLWVARPRVEQALRGVAPGAYLRVTGTVRHQQRIGRGGDRRLHYLLGEAGLWLDGERLPIAELEVEIDGAMRRWRAYRREIRIGGSMEEWFAEPGPLLLRLEDAEHHFATRPLSGPFGGRGGEWLRRASSKKMSPAGQSRLPRSQHTPIAQTSASADISSRNSPARPRAARKEASAPKGSQGSQSHAERNLLPILYPCGVFREGMD